jgi:prenyltransferase beta subunit
LLLADKLGQPAEEQDWSQGIGMIAEALAAHVEGLGIDDLCNLYVLEEATSGIDQIPHRDAILNGLASLRTDQGLFKCGVESTIADLDSTFRAVWLMQHLGSRDEVDTQAVMDFVEACRMDWGFGIAPADVSAQVGEDAYSDLVLTYEGLWLLDYCEKGQSSLPDMCSV